MPQRHFLVYLYSVFTLAIPHQNSESVQKGAAVAVKLNAMRKMLLCSQISVHTLSMGTVHCICSTAGTPVAQACTYPIKYLAPRACITSRHCMLGAQMDTNCLLWRNAASTPISAILQCCSSHRTNSTQLLPGFCVVLPGNHCHFSSQYVNILNIHVCRFMHVTDAKNTTRLPCFCQRWMDIISFLSFSSASSATRPKW